MTIEERLKNMMGAFEMLWEYLMKNLKTGTKVQNWTADKGYLDDEMIIRRVTDLFIDVEAQMAKHIQVIPKEHFKKVYEVWEDYRAKAVRRSDVRDMTRFSKYIISILKWWENEIT